VRRWNGWGDDSMDFPVPGCARAYLEEVLGEGTRTPGASLSGVIGRVPRPRLPTHKLVTHDPLHRVRHARGQSLPDWIALRSGNVPLFPDGVAYPQTTNQVRELMLYAKEAGARLIPYGGGTSVVGHVNPPGGDAPVLTMDMGRMNRLLRLDEKSGLATFGAGAGGPEVEAQLRAHGLTLGHFPQSFEYSTIGGWVATRSSGQQSAFYGRMERLFAGGRLESPAGTMELPPFPASAAGPDLRELVLGSEGRMGVLTHAIVRAVPLPEREGFFGVFFPDFRSGLSAVMAMVQARLPLSMARLNNAAETHTSLLLAERPGQVAMLERYLGLRRAGPEKCLALLGCTGRASLCRATRRAALSIARANGGIHIGRAPGNAWRLNRFRIPYLRNGLWEAGYATDTLETALPWSQVVAAMTAVEAELGNGLDTIGERVHVMSHVSHVYPDGASLYTTYIFRLAPDPAETFDRWLKLKTSASLAIAAHGGTISHQHGVGIDHAPYLPPEKGKLGMATLGAAIGVFDPGGMMNPGKLILGEH